MRAFVFAAVLGSLVGCRIDLDTAMESTLCEIRTVSACTIAAETDPQSGAFLHSDFNWISTNILNKNCTGSACHEQSSTNANAKRLVFDQGPHMAYTTLVADPNGSIDSAVIARTTMQQIPLVQPGDPTMSYLMFMMKAVPQADFIPSVDPPPADVQYMPRGNETLCCQKLDVLDRWITAGASE